MISFDGWYHEDRERETKRTRTPRGMTVINEVKPKTDYYHYSRDDSQGALICQTKDFPTYFNRGKQDYHAAYSDRIMSWDHERFKKACEIAGGGDGVWAYRLTILPDDKLRKFAQVALDLPELPIHVRIVHWFNVATGYSCPTVEAITNKS